MLIPLHAFVRGDTLGVLALVRSEDTIAALAAIVADAVSMRVAPGARAEVRARGAVLDPTATVEGAGLGPLDRVDVWMIERAPDEQSAP